MKNDIDILDRKQKAREVDYELIPPFPKEYLIDITSLCNHTCKISRFIRYW